MGVDVHCVDQTEKEASKATTRYASRVGVSPKRSLSSRSTSSGMRAGISPSYWAATKKWTQAV